MPRAAIRMQQGNIAEVRGIGPDQNLDPFINDVVKEKLTEFPDGAQYENRATDMKKLTEIEKKAQSGQQLSKDELTFLYELDQPIEGFGYQRDPRIKEIREQRNPKQDALVVFDCETSQIASNPQEINQNTKAYIGPLEKGIFDKIQKYNIEHVFTRFPEEKIQRYEITIGGKSKEELEKERQAKNIKISPYAQDIFNKMEMSRQKEETKLIRLTVKDLGFSNGATTDQIYQKAEELGLELCPPETGPLLRLQEPIINEYSIIGMKQIADRDGAPIVFNLDRYGGDFWLNYNWAKPDRKWYSYSHFVFRLRKFET